MPPLSSESSKNKRRVPDAEKKKRRAITDAEKKLIRDFYYKDPDNKPSLKTVQTWFEENYYHRVASSSLSEILSPQYDHLSNIADISYPD